MKTVVIFYITALSISILSGQDNWAYYLGIQPAVMVEPFYDKGEFDINVVPVVIQTSLNKRIDVRKTTLVNYHFGDEQSVSDAGVEISSPIFLKKKSAIGISSGEFYIGPSVGIGKNYINDHKTLTMALEPE